MKGPIPEEERHALGQYFTREDLADLIIGLVADRDEAFYLDPTCGSGAFLDRLYSRLRRLSAYKATPGDLLGRLWGVDIAHFPAELATINLFRRNVRDIYNFPRVVVQDFFRIRPGQEFEFPPTRPSPRADSRIRLPIPSFHGIVGNFPYIRQELIGRRSRGYKREIVQAIAREWFWKDPDLFDVKGVRKGEWEKVLREGPERCQGWLDEQVQKGRVDLRLSGQADIYAYLFYHAAAFLEEGGRMGIVTSNAWLDVAYGEELKRFFLRNFRIIAVVASWCEPWFGDAAINTAFVILERCEDPERRARNVVRFVKVKRPLSELLPRDLLLREAERWDKVDALVREIEAADALVASWDPTAGRMPPLKGIHTVETDAFRIRLVPQAELEAELQAKGPTAKWGLYIRAPQVYFDLLREAGDRLVPLSRVAEVRFGIKTGINDFFYLEPLDEPAETSGAVRVKNARGWVGEIEEACLRPVIKSPKEAKGLVVDPSGLKYRLFFPPVDPTSSAPEQDLQHYPLAYQYVKWGEGQRTPTGQPWPQVPSVQGRKAWWLLPYRTPGRILMPMVNDRRFAIFQNADTWVDHNLFEFLVPDEYVELVAGLMNSSLFALVREVVSRVNLGDGATKTEGVDWKESILVPAPGGIDKEVHGAIVSAYNRLKNRPVGPIAQEVKREDRRALDEAVLEALGLDPGEYLLRVYEGLVGMVEERLVLPKMRMAREKEGRLNCQVKGHVRRDALPAGLRPITAFLPPGRRR